MEVGQKTAIEAGFRHQAHFALFQMDGMAKQGLVAQKAVMFINAQIIGRIRVERPCESDLVVIFRQMGLHRNIQDVRALASGLLPSCSGVDVIVKRGVIT